MSGTPDYEMQQMSIGFTSSDCVLSI